MPDKNVLKRLKDPKKDNPGGIKNITLPRLVLESIKLNGTPARFEAVVFNVGTMPSFSAIINVYCGKPGIVGFNTSGVSGNVQPVLAATVTIKIGIGERKSISLRLLNNIDTSCLSFFAIIFDPLLDPFPFSNTSDFSWLGQNLLQNSQPPSLIGWQQYDYSDDRDDSFHNGHEITGPNKTWKNINHAEVPSSIPSQPIPESVAYVAAITGIPYHQSCIIPGNPVTRRSELRYVISLPTHTLTSQEIVRSEIRKGNVQIKLTAVQINFKRTPNRDKSAIWLEGRRVQRGTDSVIPSEQMPLISHIGSWAQTSIILGLATEFNTIHVKLVTDRIHGTITNAYFAQIHCSLIHRQLKRFSIFAS